MGNSPSSPSHPYHPPTLSLPTYRPPTLSPLLAPLLLLLPLLPPLILLNTHLLPRTLPTPQKLQTTWLLLSGLLHIFFEGYYIRHTTTIISSPSYLAQLWKEYALSDSRYILSPRDPFVYPIELVTVAVTGPLCLCVVAGMVWVYWEFRAPGRTIDVYGEGEGGKMWLMGYLVVGKAVVATAHLWGVALYFLTALESKEKHGGWSRPEWRYEVGYFWMGNLPWGAMALWMLYTCITDIQKLIFTAVLSGLRYPDPLSAHCDACSRLRRKKLKAHASGKKMM
ncbi:Emopamil binding protein-domain-containing protein [Peziza echinospora]|nr:Emopamil binding protein-domain-containing protein [Peziza echinospora]